MIIKIKQKQYPQSDRFWIYDNLSRVIVGEEKVMDKEQFDQHIEEVNYQLIIKTPGWRLVAPEEKKTFHRVSAVNKSGDEVVFLFNTEAYLLNDDGKTVEIVR